MMKWEDLDALVEEAARKCKAFSPFLSLWQLLTAPLRDPVAAEALMNEAEQSAPSDSLLDGDAKLLYDCGFFTGTNGKTPRAWIKVFSVIEDKKGRRRVVGWPRALNEAERARIEAWVLKHGPTPEFATTRAGRELGIRHRFAAQLDFKRYFQQFELLCAEFFAAKCRDGNVYFLSTIPTGATSSPFIAQIASLAMLHLAVIDAKVTDVSFDCMIDNLRMVSNDLPNLSRAWTCLLSRCEQVGAQIGEIMHPGRQTEGYTFIGMRFFPNSKKGAEHLNVVTITDSRREEIRQKALQLRDAIEFQFTWRDMQHLFGLTVFVAQVLNITLGMIYGVVKFMRRKARLRPAADEHVSVWQCAVPQWCHFLETTSSLAYAPVEVMCKHIVYLFTDASDNGWGVVICAMGWTKAHGGHWSDTEREKSINALELRAAKIGVELVLAELGDDVAIHVWIDNTSAKAWIEKKQAGGYVDNATAIEISRMAYIASVHYIASAENPADPMSRIRNQLPRRK